MGLDSRLQQQALEWAVRTGDPAFTDWESFTLWLEADPAHALAYDRIAASVADIAEAGLPAAEPIAAINDNPPERKRWRIAGPALAAGLALVAGLWGMTSGSETFVTAPGEIRQIALDDGSTITLAGGSRLEIDGKDARSARLDQGQALFTIRHDAKRPFEVTAGEDRLIDIGTVFEVRRSPDATSVAVSEGAVLFNPDSHRHTLHPGDRAVRRKGAATLETDRIPLALVGEWRDGRLTFRNAPLSEVADDLSRASGLAFSTAPGADKRRVSGSVLIGPIKQDPASLGPILNVVVRPQGKDWIIAP